MRTHYKLNTGARLVAAVSMAVVGYASTAMYIKMARDAGSAFPAWLAIVGAICFAVMGWNSLGMNSGYGGMKSIQKGVINAAFATLITCFVYGLFFMVQKMLKETYLDPFETLFDWIQFSFEFFLDSFSIPVWAILLAGGAVAGRLTGLANKYWK